MFSITPPPSAPRRGYLLNRLTACVTQVGFFGAASSSWIMYTSSEEASSVRRLYPAIRAWQGCITDVLGVY